MRLIDIIKLMDEELISIYDPDKSVTARTYISKEVPYKYLMRKIKHIEVGEFEIKVYF